MPRHVHNHCVSYTLRRCPRPAALLQRVITPSEGLRKVLRGGGAMATPVQLR